MENTRLLHPKKEGGYSAALTVPNSAQVSGVYVEEVVALVSVSVAIRYI